uniref:DCD domain-containing protein n=2 Tax=Davidia involucrata TaxID=16924 RepID=A0A5B6YVS6_DAVIN
MFRSRFTIRPKFHPWSTRFSMEYGEEENGIVGRFLEAGAIFMSNIATKSECFKRKLFGLPSAQANFVKHVKAGMLLFLFEFERRELYGVFRACSNGSMNIVPHAFSSSRKQFPAQVRFTLLRDCRPLYEHEFRDAIKNNYFSLKKFNFGLFENQVRKLMWFNFHEF